MTAAVTRWIARHARPVPVGSPDPHAALDDPWPVDARTRDAVVVALGASTRQARELSAVAHRILRTLVEEAGFRALALEGDDAVRTGLAAYVAAGDGDPRALLARARPFWRTEEILAAVRWIRAYNARHPGDPVRFVSSQEPPPHAAPLGAPTGLAEIERAMAGDTVRWHERTGDKIVYWGGGAHTAVGDPRTVSPPSPPSPPLTHRNLGGHLRERFGDGYVSVGLLFHHGTHPLSGHGHGPVSVPAPPPEFAEAVLGGAGGDAFALDLRAPCPEPVRAWFEAPAMTRLVGPFYDPEDDAAHHLSGGSLAGWFDALVHVREVTPVGLLTDAPHDTPHPA
ncbi:erythromycin esterase family protein [Streptomyces daliensis]|uniref:Erythromycin esterase family protein n=1 Tax=Streptomyces daliensis TaxID=299421 RepID=A0A8T4IQC9_9ACTN|nr:erythromycin esterase family protein [Streptomyces daliensis]